LSVARIIMLDSGPIGLAAMSPNNNAKAAACQAWIVAIHAAGADVIIPAVADFEVRRELVRLGLGPSIIRLDNLKARYNYLTPAEVAWAKAAELWALVRAAGVPTAGPKDLDADAIIAGQALTIGQPGDVVTLATGNVHHMARFPGLDAQDWPTIA
jgi:predicted nucleic acid-binding protein